MTDLAARPVQLLACTITTLTGGALSALSALGAGVTPEWAFEWAAPFVVGIVVAAFAAVGAIGVAAAWAWETLRPKRTVRTGRPAPGTGTVLQMAPLTEWGHWDIDPEALADAAAVADTWVADGPGLLLDRLPVGPGHPRGSVDELLAPRHAAQTFLIDELAAKALRSVTS